MDPTTPRKTMTCRWWDCFTSWMPSLQENGPRRTFVKEGCLPLTICSICTEHHVHVRRGLQVHGSHSVSYFDLMQTANHKQAAASFFELLVLKSKNVLCVSQQEPFGDITVSSGVFSVLIAHTPCSHAIHAGTVHSGLGSECTPCCRLSSVPCWWLHGGAPAPGTWKSGCALVCCPGASPCWPCPTPMLDLFATDEAGRAHVPALLVFLGVSLWRRRRPTHSSTRCLRLRHHTPRHRQSAWCA
mmetsp:Transcript_34402/g.86396  ORF Transcript_34402/g.86396 Transcript_34402/m.86396 type:complete len:243 (-) Transcript_34402:539-1267(-)